MYYKSNLSQNSLVIQLLKPSNWNTVKSTYFKVIWIEKDFELFEIQIISRHRERE